jgi:glycosyltransferase involved in cell wall biosynthesis
VEIIRKYADNEAIRLQGYTAIRQEKNGKADDALLNRPIASSPHRHEIRWISEKDKGIYNAMNKGIRMATGEYIEVLNSGDILFDSQVTQRMIEHLNQINAERKESLGILYGNMIKVNAQGQVVGKSGYTEYSLRQFYSSTLNHDCAYIRADLFEEYGLYDENLKIVSDWKWYLQAIGLGRLKPEYVDIDVTIFDDGGISETNLELRNKERRQVLEELLPPAVLWDYDQHAFEMEQMNRLRCWKLYPLVYFIERVCFKFEKWGILG